MLEVDHPRVHGVVGKHLLSLQVRGGCGQEEIERWPVYYNYNKYFELKKTRGAPMGRPKLELLASNSAPICHAI